MHPWKDFMDHSTETICLDDMYELYNVKTAICDVKIALCDMGALCSMRAL